MINLPHRRQFLIKSGLGALGLCTLGWRHASRAAAAESKPPNIIMILADDLGYGDLGCYGQTLIQTPNLDHMATEGLRFTQCYAGSTVCAPSRCCLMTGFHTGHGRIRGNQRHPLLPEDVTIAAALKEKGYATGLIGKWGLGAADSSGIPNRQGFDSFYGYLDQARAHNYFPDYLWRNEQREFFEKWTYSHDAFTQESSKFLDDHRENPFFLYLAYTIPHAFNEGGNQGMTIPNDAPYSDRNWPQQEKNKAAMITRLDRDVGQLFKRLADLGLDDNTVVFFTSDNGPHREGGANPDFFDSNGPLRGIKRDLYEGGIRVPMMVRWPGRIQAGGVSDQVWAFWDFPATAAELAGARMPAADGISMLPALLGQPQKSHDYLYWEFHEQGGRQAVRRGDWKAVRNGWNSPLELYDLKADLPEQNNRAAAHPDLVKQMEDLMASSRTESPFYPIPK